MLIEWLKINAWKVSTIVVGFALLAVYTLDKFVMDRLMETQVVRIHIFKRTVRVPNSYVLDKVVVDEIRLIGPKGRILIGPITPNKKQFLDYVHKHQVKIRNECGINFVFSRAENSDFILLSNASEFMFIANPDVRMIENIRADLCGDGSPPK